MKFASMIAQSVFLSLIGCRERLQSSRVVQADAPASTTAPSFELLCKGQPPYAHETMRATYAEREIGAPRTLELLSRGERREIAVLFMDQPLTSRSRTLIFYARDGQQLFRVETLNDSPTLGYFYDASEERAGEPGSAIDHLFKCSITGTGAPRANTQAIFAGRTAAIACTKKPGFNLSIKGLTIDPATGSGVAKSLAVGRTRPMLETSESLANKQNMTFQLRFNLSSLFKAAERFPYELTSLDSGGNPEFVIGLSALEGHDVAARASLPETFSFNQLPCFVDFKD